MIEYIVEYKTRGGFFISCDGAFLIESYDLESATIKARQKIHEFTGYSTINYLNLTVKQ